MPHSRRSPSDRQLRVNRSVRGAQDGLWDWDVSWGTAFWGEQQFWKLLGQPDHGEYGDKEEWDRLMHPDDLAGLWAAVDQHLRGETERYSVQCRMRMPDGSYRWFQARGLAERDEHGEPAFFSGSIRDIQATKELELSLRQQLAERDRFLAMLSHELRNPLGAIRNAAEVGVDDDLPANERNDAMQVIIQQTRHVGRLLDDLLEVARITLGTFVLKRVFMDLREAVQRAVEMVQWQASRKQQRLDVILPATPLVVHGDIDRLVQMIVNLLVNAVRYTGQEGLVQCRLFEDSDSAALAITDNGVGLEPAILERIFDLFERGDLHDGAVGGLGIGLSLVRTIAEAHGGTVEAASPGLRMGSCFTVRLPVHREAVPERPPLTPARPMPPEFIKVVLIDDLDSGRRMLARWLRRRGLHVIEAADGDEGLKLATADCDVCVIDIGLPGLDGYEVARRLRANPETRNLLLVALTGFGRQEDRAASAQAGFDVHLVKPLDPVELMRVISTRCMAAG